MRGEDIKRPFNKYKFDGNLQELLKLFFDSLHNISKHLFHFKWQAFQYGQLKIDLKKKSVLLLTSDKTLTTKKQQEAQSSHYNRRQSTIFPFVSLFHCDNCSGLVTHEICYLSHELKHDAYSVRTFELAAIQILKQDGV